MGNRRADGRAHARQMRQVQIKAGVHPYAEGSAQVQFGNTLVHVTASVERERPRWMAEGDGGWVTAEYSMLPRATHTRNRREASAGKQSGRTLEIQRLIGRSLRAGVNLKQLEGISIQLDCDVIVADGGTRTAAISGGWVALMQAIAWVQAQGLVSEKLETIPIAAVSLGGLGGELLLDLCYEEDSSAEYDVNVVMNGEADLIEIQGTAERAAIPQNNIQALLELAQSGCEHIFEVQKAALASL